MHRINHFARALVLGATVLTAGGTSLAAQIRTPIAKPGFNLFTVNQDVEIGRSSAVEAEKQLSLANDPAANRYLTRIVARLAAVAPGADYPYTVKLVNANEINAFSLPGGPMYVNRGLMLAARNESELAGVLAHEMAHVALRHGTNQASTAYLAKGGLGVLGGLLGKGSSSSVINTIGGLGLNTAFLSFSRSAENQADAAGADMMARAGYNPAAMADFFDVLRAEQGRDPSKLEQFFSDHPTSAERSTRIRTLASSATVANVADIGGFESIRSRLGTGTSTTTAGNLPGRLNPSNEPPVYGTPTAINVPEPSTRMIRYRQPSGFVTLLYPSNWRVMQTTGSALAIGPTGGVTTTADGQQHIVYGVIINHYAPFTVNSNVPVSRYVPFETGRNEVNDLDEATNDLVNTIIRANPYLRAEAGSARAEKISGAEGYSVVLRGTSPITGEAEQAMLFTRGLPDGHVVYGLSIAPASRSTEMDEAMVKMMQSLVVNDVAGHRANTATTRGLRLGARQRP